MKTIENKKPIAIYGVCNTLSVVIYDIDYDINDHIIWSYSDENKLHKSKIYYSADDSYFIHKNHRFYLNEFIRI